MHSVPVILATRFHLEFFVTIAAFVIFDFVMLSVFVCLQSIGSFTLILALDAIFDAVANIVVNFEMYVVHMIL